MEARNNVDRNWDERIRSLGSRLRAITEEQSGAYELVAESFGLTLNHCVEFGLRHCSDFESRVRCYVLEEIPLPNYCCQSFGINHPKILVKFYGDRDGR